MNARKAFAFLGAVPLGAFVVVHVITTSTAISGPARFDRVFSRTPMLTALTTLVVTAPLVTHAVWGAWIAAKQSRRVNLPVWLPRLRRAIALVVLAFLVGHVVELPLRGWIGALPSEALYDVMAAHLSSTWHALPLVALAYLAGTAATLFHLGSELWATFRMSGILVAGRPSALLKWGIVTASVVLFVVSASTIVYLATGTRLLYPRPGFAPDGPPVTCSPKW